MGFAMTCRKYLEGQRFGRLVIKKAYYKKNNDWRHIVVCDCGAEKEVAGGDLSAGKVSSCGCLRKEIKTSHGLSGSPEYKIWSSIVQRCTNKNCQAYKNYGGRGIAVSEEWLEFSGFFSDMGERPYLGATIEREDNNKGYSAANCIWADRSQQSINQRLRKDNKTGYKGVSVCTERGGYTVTIQRNKKRRYVGFFKDINEAISARLDAEKQ